MSLFPCDPNTDEPTLVSSSSRLPIRPPAVPQVRITTRTFAEWSKPEPRLPPGYALRVPFTEPEDVPPATRFAGYTFASNTDDGDEVPDTTRSPLLYAGLDEDEPSTQRT